MSEVRDLQTRMRLCLILYTLLSGMSTHIAKPRRWEDFCSDRRILTMLGRRDKDPCKDLQKSQMMFRIARVPCCKIG